MRLSSICICLTTCEADTKRKPKKKKTPKAGLKGKRRTAAILTTQTQFFCFFRAEVLPEFAKVCVWSQVRITEKYGDSKVYRKIGIKKNPKRNTDTLRKSLSMVIT